MPPDAPLWESRLLPPRSGSASRVVLTLTRLSTRKSSKRLIRNWHQKGLTETDSDKDDRYVGYQIALDKEKQWNAFGPGGVR
jgi:hypothetical protein